MRLMTLRACLVPTRKERSRGQSMVEFALVAPILFLMLALMVDFGRLVYVYSAISNASKEGARTLSLVPQANSDCLAYTKALRVAQGFNLQPDPHAVANNVDANTVGLGTSTGPSTPGKAVGYMYVWPAVAQSTPIMSNCDGSPSNPNAQRPTTGAIRDVEVQITYHFTPLTPIVSGFINDFYIKTLSVTRTEY